MRLVVIAPYFPPDPTGSSVFAYQQALDLRSDGNEVLVVTNTPDPSAPEWRENPDETLRSAGVGLLRLRNIRINLGSMSWNYRLPLSLPGLLNPRFWKRLTAHSADGVIIHSTLFDLSIFALAWCALTRKRNVLVCHTAIWHDNPTVRRVMRIFGRYVLRPLCRLGKSRIVCVDKFTYENARELLGNGLDYSAIPVSVEISSVSGGSGDRVGAKYGITGSPVLLSLGHVIPLRNRVNLVNSLPLLRERFPALQVVIVGMVKDTTALELAERLGVRDSLLLTGAVEHSEVGDLLALADVELHDLNGLGLGITSVEAMAAGTPIVAWVDPDNYPGIDRSSLDRSGFINDGNPATIADTVERIVNDPSFKKDVIDWQHGIVDSVFSSRAVNDQYVRLLTD